MRTMGRNELIKRLVKVRGYLVIGSESGNRLGVIIQWVRGAPLQRRHALPQPFHIVECTTEEDWLAQRELIHRCGVPTLNHTYPFYYRAVTE
jgi:hypothetical protein